MEKQAQWLINPDGWYPYCSNCRHEPKTGHISEYCPECGSHMNVKPDNPTVVLDINIQEKIDDLITQSLASLSALPASYNRDLVRSNILKIREIIEAHK